MQQNEIDKEILENNNAGLTNKLLIIGAEREQ